MAEQRPSRKRRIPKLSDKPEPTLDRYYTSYRPPAGKPRRKHCSKDRTESELAYRRWVVENYDQATAIIAPNGDLGKSNINQSLPASRSSEKQRTSRIERELPGIAAIPRKCRRGVDPDPEAASWLLQHDTCAPPSPKT